VSLYPQTLFADPADPRRLLVVDLSDPDHVQFVCQRPIESPGDQEALLVESTRLVPDEVDRLIEGLVAWQEQHHQWDADD